MIVNIPENMVEMGNLDDLFTSVKNDCKIQILVFNNLSLPLSVSIIKDGVVTKVL